MSRISFISLLALIISIGSSTYGASLNRSIDLVTGVVTLLVAPDANTVIYALEEQLPEGVFPRDISHEGAYDVYLNKVKWGPFMDDEERILTYQIVVEGETELAITGAASWDGSEAQAAEGAESGVFTGGGFYSWILANFGPEALVDEQVDTSYDSDRDVIGLLGEFVFGLDPNAVDSPETEFHYDRVGSKLELSLRKRAELGEVTLSFWRSPDLEDWTEFDPGDAIDLQNLGEGIEALSYSWPASGGDEFIQLRYSLPD